ncbi:MAG: glycosyltransferase family 4 protein [Nitrososphaeraceae archaeon]
MEILYLTQILSPSIGGGELVFFNLAKGMVKLGHKVHIICHKKRPININDISPPSLAINTLEDIGASIHNIEPELVDRGGILLNYRHHIGYIINALRVGHALIKKGKIDIIHANVYTPVIPGTILGKVYSIPVIITVHNVLLEGWRDWSSQKNVSKATSFIGPIYEKMIFKMRIEAFHVVSKKVESDLVHFSPKAKAVVIHNGVEIQEYPTPTTNYEYEKFILYLGRLVNGKNLQVVILAFKDVVRMIPEAKLMVAGDGPMRQEWQELVNKNNLTKNVIFLGHISDKTSKMELLTKCSAVVFPSINEGFAMVPIEAFAMSRPLLISNIQPSDEIVDDNIDGFLLPPHDPTKWSEKIQYMLNNPKICEKMGNEGRKKVMENFNMAVVSSKMEQLYRNIVTGDKRHQA